MLNILANTNGFTMNLNSEEIDVWVVYLHMKLKIFYNYYPMQRYKNKINRWLCLTITRFRDI